MRILLADDEPRVRFALSVLLEQQPGLEVVGEALDAEDLLRQAEAACPDLVLLDWGLSGLAPEELLTGLRKARPELCVIALSGRPEARQTALDAGADAFVCKCDSAQRLLAVIEDCQPRQQGKPGGISPRSDCEPRDPGIPHGKPGHLRAGD